MAALEGLEGYIREKVEQERMTHAQLRDHLQGLHPGARGFSVHSLERFCSAKSIHKTARPSDQRLDDAVAGAIAQVKLPQCVLCQSISKSLICLVFLSCAHQVRPTYGWKTMTGLLASQALRASQHRVGETLRRMNPTYHQARRTSTAKKLNPVPYRADYFGHKVNIDQNEKLVMFRVTHICAVDGFSGKIVGFVTMPVKNNVQIFTHFFK